MLEKLSSGRFLATVAVIGTLCSAVLMAVYFCLKHPEIYAQNKELVTALIVCFTAAVGTIINAYFTRSDRKAEIAKPNTGGFITIKALVGLLLLSAMLWLAIPAHAEDGVSLNNGQLKIENVYWQPFRGPLNLTVPWKGAKVAYYLDMVHQPANSIVGIEGTIFKVPVAQNTKTLNGNLMLASIVAGEQNKGMLGLSFDVSPLTVNITDNWHFGPWGSSTFSGYGSLYAGVKAYTRLN